MENLDPIVLDNFSKNFIKVLLANNAISDQQYVELYQMHYHDRVMAINREKDFHIDFDQLFEREADAYLPPNLATIDGKLYVELEYELVDELLSDNSDKECIRIKTQNIFGFWNFKKITKNEFYDNAKSGFNFSLKLCPWGSAYFSADFVNKIVIIEDKTHEEMWKENPLYLPSHKNYKIEFQINQERYIKCYANIQAKNMEEAQEIAKNIRRDIYDIVYDNFEFDEDDLNSLDIPVDVDSVISDDVDVEVEDIKSNES